MHDRDDAIWKALSDPARRTLLDLLREGPRTTGDLAQEFAQSRFGVMKHLGVLHDAGLIRIERRGRERWNHVNAARLQGAIDRWINPFQRSWTRRWSSLRAHLAKESRMREQPGEAPQDGAMTGLDIRQELELPAPVERVFRALTAELDHWWGAPYRQAGAPSTLRLDARIGAPMIETGADGHAVIWGHVEEIRAPYQLYLSGRFAVRGAIAGRIHYDLAPAGPAACTLTLTHQAVGPIAAAARARFAHGWQDLLQARLRAHLAAAAV